MSEDQPAFVGPQCYPLIDDNPVVISELGSKTWVFRGEAVVVSYSTLKEGDALERESQVDEYMIVLPDEASRVKVRSLDQDYITVTGPSLIIVPPGHSSCVAVGDAAVVRLFTALNQDLVHQSPNASLYSGSPVDPAPSWPNPPDGFRLRVYGVEDPPEGSGPPPGNLFRSTNLMVHWIRPRLGPRDPHRLHPHSHSDFEQTCLVLTGAYVHHLRTPWGTDATQWRPDVHAEAGSPSVTFIPRGVLHTSEWGPGSNRMIDIFSPPRVDFSEREGWVLNADEYPMPTKGRSGEKQSHGSD